MHKKRRMRKDDKLFLTMQRKAWNLGAVAKKQLSRLLSEIRLLLPKENGRKIHRTYRRATT